MKTKFVPGISQPCSQDWGTMSGDEKRRFCSHCQLHVHNLSAMSAAEQGTVLSQRGSRQCIAYLAEDRTIQSVRVIGCSCSASSALGGLAWRSLPLSFHFAHPAVPRLSIRQRRHRQTTLMPANKQRSFQTAKWCSAASCMSRLFGAASSSSGNDRHSQSRPRQSSAQSFNGTVRLLCTLCQNTCTTNYE